MLRARAAGPLILVLLAACTASLPPPEMPPAVVAREEPLPTSGPARFTLRLSLPLEGLDALAREYIALPQADDFQRVTAKGQNPEVEARYASRLHALHFSSRGDGLEVRAEVRYHATLRARARTPFGRVWLTKGTDWGTAQKPGRIEVTLHSRLEVKPDWQLASHTRLKRVKLVAPAMQKVCSSGAFRLCIDADLVKREIHRQLEGEVRRRVEAELASLDGSLVRAVPLREAAESLWQGLSVGGARLGLTPRALAVAPPRVKEAALQLDLRVEASPAPAGQSAGPLPKARRTLEGADVLPLRATLDWAALDAALTASLPLPLSGTTWSLASVAVRGPAPAAGRYWLACTLREGEREHTVHGAAALAVDGTTLTLSTVEWTDPSWGWLQQVGLAAALVRVMERLGVDLAPPLRARRSQVARTLAGAAGPLPLALAGLDELRVRAVFAAEGGVVVQGVAR